MKFKKFLGLLAFLLFVSVEAQAALTLTRQSVESAGSETKMVYQVAFDSSYATGGESLTPADLGLSVITRMKVSNDSGYMFEYDYSNEKIKVYSGGVSSFTPTGTNSAPTFTGTAIASETIAITDDDTAASNGVAVYIGSMDGVQGWMQFVSPTNADGTGTVESGGSTYSVRDDDTAASLYSAAQLYFDEDAASDDRRFLANFANGVDHNVALPTGQIAVVAHDASASSNGVAVYFDEDAANSYERLLFVSPTDTNGSLETDDTLVAYKGVSAGTNSAPTFTGDAVSGAVASEVANTTDLSSALTAVRIEAYGR